MICYIKVVECGWSSGIIINIVIIYITAIISEYIVS